MSVIWTNPRCTECGEEVTPQDEVVLTARVKVTPKGEYRSPRPPRTQAGERMLRVNFYAGGKRSVKHVKCPDPPADKTNIDDILWEAGG